MRPHAIACDRRPFRGHSQWPLRLVMLLAGGGALWLGLGADAQPPADPGQEAKQPAMRPGAQPRPANIEPDLAETAPVVPPAPEQVIDLAAALHLGEGINPTISASRLAITEAMANQLRARSLMLPHLRAGTNYHNHQGVLQNSFGKMRRVDEQSLYVGGGARTLAAETVAYPMVQILSPLTDAIFEPLAARQLVTVRNFESLAVHNDILLDVAVRYLELAGAEAALAATRQSEAEMNLLVQTTANRVKAGLGRDANLRRARSNALLLHYQEQHAEEAVVVAAAALSRLLHLDPSVRLRTPNGSVCVLDLVDPSRTQGELVQAAVLSRPELAALRAEVNRKQVQYRQERWRPLLPTLMIGYSAGTFGGTTNRLDLVPDPTKTNFNNFGARTDFDVLAYWQALNAGVGNLSLQDRRLAERNIVMAEQVRMGTQIQREVTDAYALSEARRREVEVNERRLRIAEAGFREDYARIRGAVALPLEALNSMNLLFQARLSLIRATVEYDVAQFRLFVSLGQSPTDAAPHGPAAAEHPGHS